MTHHQLSRRSLLSGLSLGTVGLLASGSAAARRTGRFIVGTRSAAAERAAKSRANAVHRELDFAEHGRAVVVELPEQAVEAISQRADVDYVERDGVAQAVDTVPWGVDRIDADAAQAAGNSGAGAHVVILDTGIDADHPDLVGNFGEGYNFVANSADWNDDNGHGTHCAGTASAPDNGEGVVGVSTDAALHAAKVLDSGGWGYYSDMAAALEWVANKAQSEWGSAVASMSLGGSSSSSTLANACQYAYDRDVLVVAAAGNDGASEALYPAQYDSVVAVSATNSADDLAYFSNTGPSIELAAPGVSITSTTYDGGYGAKSGTSMAAPHVSGAAAQLLAAGYSNTDARQRLRDTAEDIGLSSEAQGYGLVDVEAALADSGGSDPDPSVAVSTGSATDVTETTAVLNGTLSDLGGASSADVQFEYGPIGGSLTNTTAIQTLSSVGSFSASVSGLDAGTSYEFRAVADASDGDSDTGSLASFSTTSADTTVVVATDGATNVGTSSATFNGTLSDLGGAASADVQFEYGPAGGDLSNTTAVQTLDATGSVSESVSGLDSGTDYEFRAVATASDGDTDAGTTDAFTTQTADTSVVVATDGESSVGTSSATLNGTLSDLGGAASADVQFEYGPLGGSLSNTTAVQTLSSTGSFSASVSGLDSGSDYEFRAVATASDGDTDAGSRDAFTTDADSGGDTAPSVDRFSVSDKSNPKWARKRVSWSVSDADGDLAQVEVALVDGSGRAVASETTSVSGSSASGRSDVRTKGSGSYSVTLTVTDAAGNSTSQTQ
ncbi:subtilisin [Halogranum gelatinilyticum]|uniref:Subtilisin n=1 Tax=Halogranum gelatinilyticum TaxID=660521 RepID=A0A1G9PXC3_9EURY|nr:S8 family serine peptidase [Halogranum gelatinilyticum]SDM03410.1 subtilisin [Halogranum gelatinilyticum]